MADALGGLGFNDAANVVLKAVQVQAGAGGLEAALGKWEFGIEPAGDMPCQRVQHVEHVVQRTVLDERLAQTKCVDVQQLGGDMEVVVDRKSTRLNSSHPSISYAVFCLKKKKIKIKLL